MVCQPNACHFSARGSSCITCSVLPSICSRFRSMMGIEGVESQPGDDDIDLGDLEALQGVVKFPVRIKCAVLGWNTLADALDRS